MGCSFHCQFCQNYEISQLGRGREVSEDELASIMLRLQSSGCHNINFVTPTHFTPQIIKAIGVARRQGLCAPLVYNCGGYESLETLKLLDGIIDIYMPDAKYANAEAAAGLSDAPDYPEVMKEALIEMHRQVGDLSVEDGLAVKGLLVRHLVLPDDLADTEAVMRFIATEISPNTYVNVMDQYRPMFRAGSVPAANRRPTAEELGRARTIAASLGLRLAP